VVQQALIDAESAILSRAAVRRLRDGDAAGLARHAGQEWCGVALGAVRISSVSLSGKQVTLTYAEPGTWFGDIALFDGLPRTHDADAHGATTLLVVRKPDFKELLRQHVELYDALLRLNCRRLRLMFNQFEDLNTRPLQARLARQLLLLAKSYGIARARKSASAWPWRRKTWRSCWAPRASASTRSSRASSAKARCAWSRRGSSCCRATSCWPLPTSELNDPTRALHRHQARPPATPSTWPRCRPTCSSTCPASPGR
jgi:hypothetical protein